MKDQFAWAIVIGDEPTSTSLPYSEDIVQRSIKIMDVFPLTQSRKVLLEMCAVDPFNPATDKGQRIIKVRVHEIAMNLMSSHSFAKSQASRFPTATYRQLLTAVELHGEEIQPGLYDVDATIAILEAVAL